MLPVKPLKAKLKIAYIFVMTQLSRDNLKPLIWNNAENRAAELYECLKNDLKYDDIQIFTNLSKEQVLDKLSYLEKIAGIFCKK